ncbi:helix-turn-helix domain-containing protein [Oceanospirillum beijerinckii]|uniref:helix-turn-helix domain-containing protein n=1 Tax=Oceanospirillum beijerinckii TaxID=64976 RepID=UPI00048837E5|nr:helix-turn-helix transcriptional regulator [Oceanospirillum beijerinckii]
MNSQKLTPRQMLVWLTESAGMTEAAIAQKCETSQPTINRIKRGVVTRPRWSCGVAISDLYDSQYQKLQENSQLSLV